VYAGASLQNGYSLEGTVTFTFTKNYPPRGNKLDFTVTAGDVTCQGSSPAASPTLHFVHADHLNTPRVVTNEPQQVVWRWENTEPFGKSPPEEDPDGDGQGFAFNLRFPGQYFDGETGLHYNYFRDYDPQTGRYLQSDPIGLSGGPNTYLYVLANPLALSDRKGLMGGGANPPGRTKPVCEGRWSMKGWKRSAINPVGIQLCNCYWLCEACDGPTLWSGQITDLPSTTNFMIYDPKKRDSQDGDIETGNACLCTRRPGRETGCCP
jgi:RHS repeat-associated protein